jgi:hypothetical protein
MTFVIAAVVVVLTIALGALTAFLVSRLEGTVTTTKRNIENEERAYNPAVTLGHRINTQVNPDEQVKEARSLAASQAAALPRGANMRISGLSRSTDLTAGKALGKDPWTATKIAQFHGWDGAKTGAPAGGVAAAAPAAATAVMPGAAPAAPAEIVLVPGKDYPYIELTEAMSPDERRKATIANSKARSAAMKAAKAAGVTAPAAAAAPAPAVGVPSVSAAPQSLAGIVAPKLIEITDAMSPDERRKATVANSKARSAFNKALKAAGIDPATVEIDASGNVLLPQSVAPVVAAAAQPAELPRADAPAGGPAGGIAPATGVDLAALGIAPPQLAAITEDMSPDQVRTARVNNSKARSAFNKALKAAGVEPASVEVGDDGEIRFTGAAAPGITPVEPQQVATTKPQAAPEPAQSQGDTVDLAALGITPPELVEISDDMPADAVRQARIANSRARSAFNKALKDAGIDPNTVVI